MNRRLFLSSIFGAAAAVAVDPERLLWVPGAKLISIPAPRIVLPSFLVPPELITREALKILEHNLVFQRLLNWQHSAIAESIEWDQRPA